MKKYFVSFVVQKEKCQTDFFANDIVEVEDIQNIQQLRKLEIYLFDQWGDPNDEDVVLINYREIN